MRLDQHYTFHPVHYPTNYMLSYRHAFHAGNHGDVLKHAVLALIIEYMQRKEKPFMYIDTHAGAGRYDLHADWAQKTREFESGILPICQSRERSMSGVYESSE